MRPFSILLFGTQIATGGAQRVLLDQARWFFEQGHKVIVVFLYDKENLRENWQRTSDFPIHVLKAGQRRAGGFSVFIYYLQALWALWILFRRDRFDVIETFTPDSNIFALPFAWLAGVPVRIATHHGSIENVPPWRKDVHAGLVNWGIASILVAVSARVKKLAIEEGVNPGRIIVIQNGVRPIRLDNVNKDLVRKQAGLGKQDAFLVSVGRLAYQKAHEILLQSMPAVLREYPNVKLGICGEGVLRPQLESQILKMGLADSVKLLGNRQDLNGFLAIADIFVLPSRWEGLPIALLEAMSAGLPVVATKVEGVDEVVVQGEQGLLVPVEDAASLAEAVLKLLQNPGGRREMGVSARLLVEQFYTVDRMCLQYLDVMLNIYRKRNKGQLHSG
jgi:glycosyltransferase involved in cell wall biosynthesis